LYKEFVGINISFNLEITALNVIPEFKYKGYRIFYIFLKK